MRIGILTQWFDPEPGPAALPGVLARGLLSRGHSIQVVTGFPNYPSGVIAAGYRVSRRLDETTDGLSVRRVALYASHDSSKMARVANYASFGASAAVSGMNVLKDVDALWVYNSPITVSWPMWTAKIYGKVPSVVHIMDLWPDSLQLTGFANRGRASAGLEKALDIWCASVYRSAAEVAYISPSVRDVLRLRGVEPTKLAYVPVWADEAIYRPANSDLRIQLGIDRASIVLLYAGALGEAQGLDTLIDACSLITDPRFVCLVAGSGASEVTLRDRARRSGTDCVRFIGRFPQSEMTALMATSDLNYIGLRPHALSRMTIPSKTQAALASGRAILVSAPGDVAQIARESGAGWAVETGDPHAVAAAIQAACDLGRQGLYGMGQKGREYYLRTFSVDHGVTRIEALLERASETRPRRRGRDRQR